MDFTLLQVITYSFIIHCVTAVILHDHFQRSFIVRYMSSQILFSMAMVILNSERTVISNSVFDLAVGLLLVAYFFTGNTFRLTVGLNRSVYTFTALFFVYFGASLYGRAHNWSSGTLIQIYIFVSILVGLRTIIDFNKVWNKDNSSWFALSLYGIYMLSNAVSLAAMAIAHNYRVYSATLVFRIFVWFAYWIVILFRETKLAFNRNLGLKLSAGDKERILNEIVVQSPSNIVVTDKCANIIYVNERFLQLNGYTESEVIGKNPRMFASGLTPLSTYKSLWETITKGEPWTGEFTNRRKNGELYLEASQVVPIFNNDREISYFLAIKQDITKEREMQRQLERVAKYDDLTGLMKRTFFNDSIRGIRDVDMSGNYFVIFDVDRFKGINDNYGHVVGDLALKSVADTTQRVFSDNAFICRLGGDEFGIFMYHTTHDKVEAKIDEFVERVRKLGIILKNGKQIFLDLSIGATEVRHGELFEDAFDRADKGLYVAKSRTNRKQEWVD